MRIHSRTRTWKRSLTEPLFAVRQSIFMYVGTVQVGSPPTPYKVLFDSGSCQFWVRDYNGNSSSSFVSAGIDARPIQYGDGTIVRGTLVNDAVNIGNVHVDSLEFESAVTDSDTESLMGLCFNGDGWSPSFVDAAVRSKQMERKLFTIGISPDALSATINFGSIDRSAHVGNVSYTPVHESSPFWQTSLLSISGAYNWKGKVDAIFDTGTSLLILPPSIVDNVASSLGFRGPDVNGWYSSRACPTDHPETFNMTFPYVSLAVPMEKLFYTYSGYCYLGMMAGDPDKVVVGNIMSRWFFTVYDWEDQRIGFANLNYTDSSVGYGPAEVVVSSGLSWTHIIVILLGIIVVGLIILSSALGAMTCRKVRKREVVT